MKEADLHIRIEKELRKKLEAGAKKSRRSLSNFVIMILEEYLEK